MNAQIILGIFFLLLTVLPVLYFGHLGKKRASNAKKALIAFAKEKNLKLDKLEYWNDKAIGINNSDGILLFVNLQANNTSAHSLDLKKMRQCSVNQGKGSVDLVFEPKQTKNFSSVRVQIYNQQYDDTNEAGYHYQVAKKWTSEIQKLINTLHSPVRKSA